MSEFNQLSEQGLKETVEQAGEVFILNGTARRGVFNRLSEAYDFVEEGERIRAELTLVIAKAEVPVELSRNTEINYSGTVYRIRGTVESDEVSHTYNITKHGR